METKLWWNSVNFGLISMHTFQPTMPTVGLFWVICEYQLSLGIGAWWFVILVCCVFSGGVLDQKRFFKLCSGSQGLVNFGFISVLMPFMLPLLRLHGFGTRLISAGVFLVSSYWWAYVSGFLQIMPTCHPVGLFRPFSNYCQV